ncbi:hypothetical protein ACHAP5_010928 [Fusarium lateritium]
MCTIITLTATCVRCGTESTPEDKTLHCIPAIAKPVLAACPTDKCKLLNQHPALAWESCPKCWAEHLAKLEEEKK